MHKLLFILLAIIVVLTTSQQLTYAQKTEVKEVKLHFIKPNVEVFPGEIFHNILIIENNKESIEEFDIFINTPSHWKIIGGATQRYRLLPGEKVYLPVQVASSGESKGGIGYAITAVMNDVNGNMIKAESCLLNIPRDSKLNVSMINAYRYFDLQSKESEFQIHVQNTGNTDQQINIRVEPGQSVLIPGNDNEFSQIHFMLEPKQDSTVNFRIRLKESTDKNLFTNHSAEIQVLGSDTIIKQTAWFNYLNWKYTNFISETERPLVLEAIGNDVFGGDKTQWQLRAYGSILFKNEQKLRYNIQNLNRSNRQNSLFWYNSRMFAEYSKTNKHIFGIGDYRGSFEQSLYGRGAWTEHRFKNKHTIKLAATKKIEYDAVGVGGAYSYNFDIPLKTTIGGAYTDNRYGFSNSLSGFIQTNSTAEKLGQLSLLYGYSLSEYYRPGSPSKQYPGHGIEASYINKFNINNINIRADYGSPMYSGISKGRLNAYVNLTTLFSDKLVLASNYSRQDYKPTVMENNEIQKNSFTNYDIANLALRFNAIKNIQFFAGPFYENKTSNTYSADTDINPFSTRKFGAEAGMRIIQAYTTNSFSFAAKYGYTHITQMPESIAERHRVSQKFPSSELRVNIRRNNWSIHAIYQQGPKSISEELAFTLSPLTIRSVMLMPSYEKWLYKRDIKLILRANYINNLTAKSSRFNLNSRIDWHMPRGWSAFIDNMFSLSYQSPYLESSTIVTGSQTSSYFRVGLKKVFNFNQPRVKFVDIDAVFYRDNNGDNLRSANEPGVSNVLAGIKRIPQEGEDKSLRSSFNSVELLSQFEGKISVNDIPAGTYELSYIPTNGREGNFITDRAVKTIEINSDSTLHIPFTDRNKVSGYVIINKAENTINDNPRLDNITILATSGSHKPERTLTNKEGYFEMYIPVSDYYQIRIENFDSEHYTLRQPFYVIKFNGYKEFVLNFVFDEKQRRVIFDDDLSYMDTEVTDETQTETTDETTVYGDDELDEPLLDDVIQPLHQINIKGEIREEATMSPVHATVQIINETTGLVITETISSLRTGVYATSFISSDEVYMKVEAKGYRVYKENIRSGRITTFDNINKDVVLKPIIIGHSLETSELLFQQGSADLTPGTKAELENMLITLHENNTIEINISGHADNQEATSGNADELSLKRAQTVAKYLTDRGINPNRINKISGKANHEPKVTETDARSRASNRRAEIRISNF